MSEHQYYEFLAIDRPLTKTEMAELRTCSSRATITATGFVNEYNWGDLHADPADWMRKYFDAFVYTANWCSCRFVLRLPRNTFDKAVLQRFATDQAFTIGRSATHWILDWSLDESQDYERFAMETGQGWMGRLAPLRDELLRGDLRALYLGWLAGVSAGEVEDDAVEPEVPPGLSQLSGAQQALVEFLGIDADLVAAAAAASQDLGDAWDDDDSVEVWVQDLRRHEINKVFGLLVKGASRHAERWAKSAYLTWLKESGSRESPPVESRTVSALRALGREADKRRFEQEEKQRARQEAERRRQREAHLQALAADTAKHWKAADACAERGTASGYDEAAQIVADLADASVLVSDRPAFDEALRRFMGRHAKRRALARRLADVGLWTE